MLDPYTEHLGLFYRFIDMIDSKEMQIGKAGEYLVCADLILKGFVAYPSEQGLPYDVVLDIEGKLYKVQVKTTTTYRTIPQRKDDMKSYIFSIKRKGKYGKKRYGKDEIDIFALVCLDTKQIGYLRNADMRYRRPDNPYTTRLHPDTPCLWISENHRASDCLFHICNGCRIP